MMKNIRNWLISFVMIASVGGAVVAATTPQTTSAAAGLSDSCNQGFLGFPSWYRGLTVDSGKNKCDIKPVTPTTDIGSFIWRIGLNVLEMAVVAVAYLSGFYFLYGGWLFIISQGKPETAAKARSTMTMALLGLVLAISAVTLMNFIVDKVVNLK